MRNKLIFSLLLSFIFLFSVFLIPSSAATHEGTDNSNHYFNEELVGSLTAGSYSLSFTSNNTPFDLILVQHSGGVRISYANTSTGDSIVVYSTSHFNDSNWRSPYYRFISLSSFGTASEEFIDFFYANTILLPTSLNGLSVYLPPGWFSLNGYGIFDVSGQFGMGESYDGSFNSFYVGYDYSYDDHDYITADNFVTFYKSSFGNDVGLSITFNSGTDLTNTSLIQWLAVNNVFTGSDPEPDPGPDPEPDPEPEFILRNGFYAINQNPVLPDLSDLTPGEGFSFLAEPGSYFLDSSYKEHPVYLFGYQLTFYDSPDNFELRFFIRETEDPITQKVWFAVRVQYGVVYVTDFPDLQGHRLLRFYNFGDVTMDEFSFEVITSLLKPSNRPAPPFEGNPWVYILDMIIEALQVNLFGYFSIWDIFSTLCGLFLLIWLLKLIAGG